MLSIDPTIGAHVVEIARQWLGTPYRHQGRLMGSRVDCVGLILMVGFDMNILTMTDEEWTEFAGYSRTPNPERMGRAMEKFLVRLDVPPGELGPDGSIPWMEWRDGLPMHLGVAGTFEGRRTLIHAYEHMGRCVEHGFVAEWPDRVASWWAYPGSLAPETTPDAPVSGRDRA